MTAAPLVPIIGRVALGVLLLGGAIGGIMASPISAQSPNGWLLSPGSMVAGLDVGGLSPRDAVARVATEWESFREAPWTLTVGEAAFEVTPAQLGLSAELAKLQEALEHAQPAPKTTWDRVLRWVTPLEAARLDLSLALDQPTFDAWVTAMRPQVERPATDARLDWEARQTIPEQAGQTFDKGEWQRLIDDPLARLVAPKLTLPVESIPPQVTAAQLDQVNFEQPFAEFSTRFDIRKANRSHNIRTAIEKWQGVVIPPRTSLSFNATVGQRTAKNGYKPAPVYENRRVSEGLGGGICQVSTTLYNAALLAGLKIDQRGGHSRPCDYAPPGRDSTVDWPHRDLKFTNPYDFPLYIDAETDGGTVWFRLYGDPARKPNIVMEEEVSWLGGPGEPDMVLNPGLPEGTKKTEDAGFAGRKIVVTRIWDPGTPQERRETISTDRISALRGIVRYNPGAGGALAPETTLPENPEGVVPPEAEGPMPF